MSQSLWMVYRSKDSTAVFTTTCPDGDTSHFTSPRQLTDNTGGSAAMTNCGSAAIAFQGALWIAYVEPGTRGYIYLARSTDAGLTFHDNIYLGEGFASNVGPTLAVFDDRLWLFWRSKTSNQIFHSSLDSWETQRLTAPQPLLDHDSGTGATTNFAPAAITFQGALWVAYVEPGTKGYIYFARSTDGGKSFQAGIYLGQNIVSSAAPALTVFDDRLWLVWRSKTDSTLFVSSVASWSVDQFTSPRQIANTAAGSNTGELAKTNVAPAAAGFGGYLWVAYVEPGTQGYIYFARSTDGGANFQIGIYLGQGIVSGTAPALYGDFATSGAIQPKFQILSILYSPPGAGSSVTYNTGSSVGSTLSVSSNAGGSVSLTAEVEADGNSAEAGVSQSVSAGNSRDLTITKSEEKIWSLSPPDQSDDIDHGNDMFKIIVNPVVKVRSGNLGNLTWSLVTDGKPQAFDVLLKWIHPAVDQTQNAIAHLISDFGFTADDFAQLASCNPFCSSPVIDNGRFKWVSWATYEYGTGSETTYSLRTEELKNYTCSKSASLEVSCSVTAGFSVAGIGASVTQENRFTWETSSSNTESSTNDQTASATIGNPSKDWTGSSEIHFFLDMIYNTFMFSFDEGSSTSIKTSVSKASIVVA